MLATSWTFGKLGLSSFVQGMRTLATEAERKVGGRAYRKTMASEKNLLELAGTSIRKALRVVKEIREHERPKRPLTPFFCYLAEKRGEFAENNPSYSLTQSTKILAEQFSQLDSRSRQIYDDMAQKYRDSYQASMESFKKAAPPQYPLSNFLIFSQEYRPTVLRQYPEMSMIEIGRVIGEKWRSMDDSAKEKYNVVANKSFDIYRRECREYIKRFVNRHTV